MEESFKFSEDESNKSPVKLQLITHRSNVELPKTIEDQMNTKEVSPANFYIKKALGRLPLMFG